MKRYFPILSGILLCLLIGLFGSYVTNQHDYAWYNQLHKPAFNPPRWLFAPVWILLYIMMGVALGLLWKAQRYLSLSLFAVQLIFNGLWSYFFFGLHSIRWALYDMMALWFTLMLLLFSIKNDKKIFALLLPYFLWVSFAALLNITLLYLN